MSTSNCDVYVPLYPWLYLGLYPPPSSSQDPQQERLNALGNYYASPVAADGRVIVASLDGKVTVFAAGVDTPKILHQTDFKERIAATPALVKNQLYLRTPTALLAFGE